MTSGWRGGSQGQAGAESSQLVMSRSTSCPAPNTPQMTSHLPSCLPSLRDPRVQDVRYTLHEHLCHLSLPPLSVQIQSIPPWSRLHLPVMAAHSHAPPHKHLFPKKSIDGHMLVLKLLHQPTRTASGLGHIHYTRAPRLQLLHLLLSRHCLCTELQLPQLQTLPDTLSLHRLAFTWTLCMSSLVVLLFVITGSLSFLYNAWHVLF